MDADDDEPTRKASKVLIGAIETPPVEIRPHASTPRIDHTPKPRTNAPLEVDPASPLSPPTRRSSALFLIITTLLIIALGGFAVAYWKLKTAHN